MARIFMLVMQPCYGESGGGHGIEYRLYRQNEKYHLMDDVYFIFSDRVIKNGEPIGEVAKKKSSNIGKKTKKDVVIFKPNFLRAIKVYLEYNRVCDYVKKLDKKYHFTNDDIYIFHDVKMAFAFAKLYDFSKTALIYHMQGSVYNEWKSFSGISSSIVQNTFNAIFKRACSKLRFLCFPSKGAKESLLESAPELEKFINQCNCKVVYNGVNCPDVSTEDLTIDAKSSEQEYSFITVAALNEAKAVERIPQYLEKLKQAGIRFKWILVGNGVMASIVQDEITKHSIKDNTVWFKEPVAHETILKMMSQCDFYILFHKQSVFDLSTLEAMHYGNIPILTPVGGNKEMIEEGSGFFVDDFTDASELLTAIHDDKIEYRKQMNRDLQMSKFDEYSMLVRYSTLCHDLL